MAANESRRNPAPRLKFDEIIEWIEETTAEPLASAKVPRALLKALPSNVVQLPIWPDAARAVPNGVLRSALFGVIERGARRYMEVVPIAAVGGIELFYTGPRLDQGDLDVWLGVLHLCRVQAMGEQCFFTAYELLKVLGKTSTGGKHGSRRVLDVRLSRLKATAVRIKTGRYSYEGSLLDEAYRDHETKRYVVALNPKMRALFEPDQFTQVDQAVRHELDGKPLAQWLHGFYASHAEPFAISVSKLRELCGSEVARERDFKPKLRKALQAVADACEAHAQPFRFALEGDLVSVERTPSPVQRRHLAKRARKPSP